MNTWTAIGCGFIWANVCALIFNCVGMGIMSSQLGDFYAGKRADIFGPPPWKYYLSGWVIAWALISVVLAHI